MAKRITTRKSSSLRPARPAAARLFSHPLARELLAASLVYAAASIIRGQAKSGSLSHRLMQDAGHATDAMRNAAGGLGSIVRDAHQAITPALETLMQHFSQPESSSTEAGPRTGAGGAERRRSKPRNSPRKTPSAHARPRRKTAMAPDTLSAP
jgi:hypothetical protein